MLLDWIFNYITK